MTRLTASRAPEPSRQAAQRRYAARNAILRANGYKNYAAYLQSAHWRRVRHAYRASDLPQECICGDYDVQLHHLTYERVCGEWLSDLAPLCPSCHSLVHTLEWRGEIGINMEGLTDAERAEHGRAWLAEQVATLQAEAEARAKAERERVLAMSFAGRLTRAVSAAKRRHVDISHDLHILRLSSQRGSPSGTMTRRLRRIEASAYGWDDWVL